MKRGDGGAPLDNVDTAMDTTAIMEREYDSLIESLRVPSALDPKTLHRTAARAWFLADCLRLDKSDRDRLERITELARQMVENGRARRGMDGQGKLRL